VKWRAPREQFEKSVPIAIRQKHNGWLCQATLLAAVSMGGESPAADAPGLKGKKGDSYVSFEFGNCGYRGSAHGKRVLRYGRRCSSFETAGASFSCH
jgi:hypothetical protein